jgi:type II secretory pathway pseudopilin PulG
LLVTITIIGLLAGMTLGALQMAGNAGKEAATKSTIAKLNSIIMQRYESYMTRRVPISTTGLSPTDAAKARLCALRDLMRMEMPDFFSDITTAPLPPSAYSSLLTPHATLPTLTTDPALRTIYNRIYTNKTPSTSAENAKCLYLVVSVGSPEAMEQFNESEIGVDSDGWQYFVDGWGRPIMWLRWAPGFSNGSGSPPGVNNPRAPSDIQTGDSVNDHDPFDTRNVQPTAFHLIPLIYSFGPDGKSGISLGNTTPAYTYTGDPFGYSYTGGTPSRTMWLGTVINFGTDANCAYDNITNHHIEQR